MQKLIIAHDNGQTVEIDRDGANWKIVKPTPSAADDNAVRSALSTLVNARAADFINDAPANVNQYGLEKPHLTATVVLKNGEQQSMLFGFKQNGQGKSGIYVRRGERAPVYAVAEYTMSSLDKSPLDFRDKTIVKVDPESVDTVKVKTSDGEFTLKRAAAELECDRRRQDDRGRYPSRRAPAQSAPRFEGRVDRRRSDAERAAVRAGQSCG